MRVVIQIGYTKSFGHRKEGQKLSAFINDVECTWADKTGHFLTSYLDTKKGKLWYLCTEEVEHGDAIRVQVFTTIAGVGKDERRTLEMVYAADENASIQEVEISGVGMKGYPLLKGRLVSLGSVSEADNREAEAEAVLDDENF